MDTELKNVPTSAELSTSGDEPDTSTSGPRLPGGNRTRLIIIVAVCAVLALVSAFPLANHYGNPATYEHQIAALDAKASTVMALVGTSTSASALVSLAPDDIGTPIADKLVDLSTDFAVVLGAIYLEKYLLTILGMVSCRVLVPLGLATVVLMAISSPGSRWHHIWGQLSFKLLVFAVVGLLVVPVSVWASDMIWATYEQDNNIEEISETAAEDASQAQQESDSSGETSEAGTSDSQESADAAGSSAQDGDLLGNISGWVAGAGSAVTSAATDVVNAAGEGATKLVDSARDTLNDLVEKLVVMVVADCVVPILGVLFFVWLARMILGINVDVSARVKGLRSRTHRGRAAISKKASDQ